MNLIVLNVATVLAVLWAGSSAEKGCPEPEDVEPCVCYESLYTVLECQHVTETDALIRVFQNSARYTYHEIYLKYSSLPYLPRDMFEHVPIKKLYLVNVTLTQLFDVPPDTLSEIDTLHIENTRVLRRMNWDLLEPMTQLRILDLYYVSIKTLDEEFSTYVSKELQQLTFYATGTTKIKPGVFNDFAKLDKIAIDACKLTSLSRDSFPKPFNGRVLYFNYNKITTIPDDLFTDMPNLQTLGLRENQIAAIPESAFTGSFEKIVYFMLEGNPLKCDCRLLWLIRRNIEVLSGTCEVPKKLHDKELKDLTTNDFNC